MSIDQDTLADVVTVHVYDPLNQRSQARVWEITGELVDFQHFVWFNKVTRTWDRFGPESVFTLFNDGHVEVSE